MAVDRQYTVGPTGSINVSASGGLLDGIVDKEGATLSATVVQGPTVGTLTLASNGSYVYVSPVGYRGQVNFTYTVSDGFSTTQAQVSLELVGAANPPPTPPSNPTPSTPQSPSPTTEPTFSTEASSGDSVSAENATAGTAPAGATIAATPQQAGQGKQERAADAVLAAVGQAADADSWGLVTEVSLSMSGPQRVVGSFGMNQNMMQSRWGGTWNGDSQAWKFSAMYSDYGQPAFELNTLELERTLSQFSEDTQERTEAMQFAAGTASAVFLGATTGVAVWCMSGSYLVSVVAATIPAWARFDPIFVVQAAVATRNKDDDDTSLADLTREHLL